MISAYIPALAFTGLLVFVVGPWDGRWKAVAEWQKQPGSERIAQVLVVLAAAYALALLLDGFAARLVRLFEGYWPGPTGRPPRRIGRAAGQEQPCAPAQAAPTHAEACR